MFKEREQQKQQEQLQVGPRRTTRSVEEVSRVLVLEKRLADKIAEVENEKEINSVDQQGLQKRVEDLNVVSLEKDAEISDLKRKLENKGNGADEQEEVFKNLEDVSANVC